MARRLRRVSLPIALLAIVSLVSLAARVAWVGQPCHEPCRSSADHVLVFDESYYVDAARVIAGIAPPPNMTYAAAPLGDDPNAEHPQLAKLLVAGSIQLLGDGPLAWRLPNILLGSVAILGMFALAQAAGDGDWVALGAAALMAGDNLLLVHSRIATLDVPVLATMLWGTVLYLRGHPIIAGALIGIGTCIKLVAPYALLVLVLVESLRKLTHRGGAVSPARVAARLGACVGTAAAVFVGLLAVLDLLGPPYDAAKARLLAPGPFHHIAHMLSYGANQTSPHGPTGIASYPWAWLVDFKPIVYLNVNPARPSAQLYDVHPAVHFLGMISPPIMLLGVPALLLAGWRLISGRRRDARSVDPRAPPFGGVPNLALAWFIGTLVPFLLLSLLLHRTSYLYYMVVVMPGIYLAAADLSYRARRYRRLLALWILLALAAAVVMYPFTPLP